MKTIFIFALRIIFTLFSVMTAASQKASNKQTDSNLSPSEISRSFPVEMGFADIIENETISDKLPNRFNKLFKNGINVKWYKAGENFRAEFRTEETSNTSLVL